MSIVNEEGQLMSRFTRKLDKLFYPGVAKNWDDYIFRSNILDSLNKNSIMLDLGAGAGIVEAMNFKGK